MLLYDHSRTAQIIARLRMAEAIVRIITILGSIALFGFAGLSAGEGVGRTDTAAITGVVVGAVAGFIVGGLSMILLSATVEWMCQILIALGDLVEASKRGRA